MYEMGSREAEAVRKVIESGQLFRYHEGETATWSARFERDLAEKVGVRYALATSSGTGATVCALVGLGVGPGDEVIVPAYTFIATALAVMTVGAVPVIAEVDDSLTLDPEDVERKLSPHTQAIIPVHMLGLPCDMGKLTRLARKHKVKVLEDAAQAAGGSWRGKRFGANGDVGIYSFNYYKIISSGEGGAVLTDDKDIYHRALMQHDGGCAFFSLAAAEGAPVFAGGNYRVSEITTAILCEQLKRLDGILKRLRARKAAMAELLARSEAFDLSPVRDADGDCATTVGLRFDDADAAAAFAERHAADASMFRPIDTNRHVYGNWEAVMEHVAAHPAMDPFQWAKRKIDQGPDCCPRSLDVMGRTVCVRVPYGLTLAETRKLARRLLG